ncbi:hypothetical protein EA472_01765 [Natrarchaeobius oligotrophus]|uniref:Uncharacterized protein n=1 Tax=Natrarchaeobius chitinivorans TaxID=1679083 RepID=A0A3N6MYY3_NATCH|nr:hypothetical protein EA472_01765 [Natrarchaeobius chitinivorans]
MHTQHTTPRPDPSSDQPTPRTQSITSFDGRPASARAPATFSARNTDRLRNLVDEFNAGFVASGREDDST